MIQTCVDIIFCNVLSISSYFLSVLNLRLSWPTNRVEGTGAYVTHLHAFPSGISSYCLYSFIVIIPVQLKFILFHSQTSLFFLNVTYLEMHYFTISITIYNIFSLLWNLEMI